MAFAVVGFDLGFQNSYVAVARAGGIETVANEYSDRCTASCVSFTDTMRFIGNSARQRIVSNMKDTLHGFTKFVGKSYDDPAVQAELPYLPYKLARTDTGGVGFRVSYLNQEHLFTAEQVTAMMLTKLRSVAESNLESSVVDCVLNVPTYYDDRERRALLDATKIAGLNCLKLVNDITAIALNYGLHKKDLPPVGQPSKNVLFVDMGHCDLQVGLVAFNAGRMQVLSTASDPCLGGRDLDRVLFNHFAEMFAAKHGLDARASLKAQLKLSDECARVKKLMSANSADIPVSVECLADDRDASGAINRADFNSLLSACGVTRRVRDCVLQCLAGRAEALDSVELVGGSTRVPTIREAIAGAVNGAQCRTSLNADEAVARGCALMCAMLSPACRVRQFSVSDSQPYSISLVAPWLGRSAPNCPALVAFPAGCDFPSARALRLPVPPEAGLAANVAFDIAAGYTNRHDVAVSDRQISKYRLTSAAQVQKQQRPQGQIALRLQLALDCHGVFAITRASLEEEVNGDKSGEADANDEEGGPGGGFEDQQQQVAISRWSVPLDIVETLCAAPLSNELLGQYRNLEVQMADQEAREHERISARNSVEEYVYEMRDRMAGGLADRLTDAERVGFADALSATEAWLYGEGERLDREAYTERLARLRREGDSYCRRGEAAGKSRNNNGIDNDEDAKDSSRRRRRRPPTSSEVEDMDTE